MLLMVFEFIKSVSESYVVIKELISIAAFIEKNLCRVPSFKRLFLFSYL